MNQDHASANGRRWYVRGNRHTELNNRTEAEVVTIQPHPTITSETIQNPMYDSQKSNNNLQNLSKNTEKHTTSVKYKRKPDLQRNKNRGEEIISLHGSEYSDSKNDVDSTQYTRLNERESHHQDSAKQKESWTLYNAFMYIPLKIYQCILNRPRSKENLWNNQMSQQNFHKLYLEVIANAKIRNEKEARALLINSMVFGISALFFVITEFINRYHRPNASWSPLYSTLFFYYSFVGIIFMVGNMQTPKANKKHRLWRYYNYMILAIGLILCILLLTMAVCFVCDFFLYNPKLTL